MWVRTQLRIGWRDLLAGRGELDHSIQFDQEEIGFELIGKFPGHSKTFYQR